ncbi:protein PET117 homolog, mitochondrial [Homalodisca vitripennis]|uniref:protein PET117 homolog, mitochondrial n=1 Tax=Homalodisca vitripennis TaxID=197043 RepID=UPI001EEA362F|nr:protein PET117 homolog, mitochondrial [Homalodisca vitripennis]KAG8276070.1 hypothetical protein J6590_072859 [Homalodisca vitripennis]
MSLPAKITLATSCVVSAGIIAYVHFKQQLDRVKLHEGVVRDVERRQRRKAENIYVLEQQKDLTKKYQALEESQH